MISRKPVPASQTGRVLGIDKQLIKAGETQSRVWEIREEPGHWEGDSLECPHASPCSWGSIRKSKYSKVWTLIFIPPPVSWVNWAGYLPLWGENRDLQIGWILTFLDGWTWHTVGVWEKPDPSFWVLPHLLIRSSGARGKGKRIKGRKLPTTAVIMLPGDGGRELKSQW